VESHGFLVPIGNPILMVTVADRIIIIKQRIQEHYYIPPPSY